MPSVHGHGGHSPFLTVTVKTTTIENMAGSWVINYEKVENAVITDDTVTYSQPKETTAARTTAKPKTTTTATTTAKEETTEAETSAPDEPAENKLRTPMNITNTTILPKHRVFRTPSALLS